MTASSRDLPLDGSLGSPLLVAPDDHELVALPHPCPADDTADDHQVGLAGDGNPRDCGVTWTSLVPGPITHWSCPGRNRTAFEGRAATSESTSSPVHVRQASTSTATSWSRSSSSQLLSRLRPAPGRCRASSGCGRRSPVRRSGGTPMARGPASSRSGTPVHLGLRSRRWNVRPVAGWPEAHVPLPGQRLDQRARALVEDRFQVPVRAVSRQHVTELGDGQRPIAERLAHGRPEAGPVRCVEPVVLHPARQLPLPPGRSEREVDAAVLGREVVHRPAERTP